MVKDGIDPDAVLVSIDKKLGLLLGLLIKKDRVTIKEQVAYLQGAGLNYKEIAQVLSISQTHAGKELSRLRK